jgi:glycosyltransferase involved in cell wall biosynthesis
MMSLPCVTVCIPTRNRAALLTSAISSVLSQSFGDYILLVADNASEDGTEALVRSFTDPRLRYLRHDADIGPAANFNACLRAAESEHVLMLCDDDVLHPGFLEAAVRVLRSNDRIGFVYTTWQRRRDDGTIEDRVINPAGLTSTRILPGSEFIELAILNQGGIAHTSSVLMRAAAVHADGFDPRDGFAMDVGLLLRVAAHWDIGFIAAPLVSVRLESDSLTGRIVGLGSNGRVKWDLDADLKRREVKMRFLEGPGRDLSNAASLRRAVNRIFRRRVMWHSAMALRSGGHLRAAGHMLAQGLAVDAGLVWDPYAWRTGLAALAGPTLTNLVRGHRT